MTRHANLPTYDRIVDDLIEAERAEGWLPRCEDAGLFLAIGEELVAALAKELTSLGGGPILEVCAGRGELAGALRAQGVAVIATDAEPPEASGVVRADAAEALRRYRPAIVIGCFTPFDAGVDRVVLADAGVRHYLVLNARIGGAIGGACLWTDPRWDAVRLPGASQWMICRQDAWTGQGREILRHGEAWLFRRRACTMSGRCEK